MINLFRSIALSRKFHEDLATDALYYLLQQTPDQLRNRLRVSLASLWSSIPGLSLAVEQYETRILGQASGGRPDLTGYTKSKEVVLLIENKFGALPTPKQSNMDYLVDLHEGGLLLFIVPDCRRHDFHSLIRVLPNISENPAARDTDPKNAVRWQRTQDNKVIAVAGWQEVIKALQSGISYNEQATQEQTRVANELADLRWFCERKTAMEFYEPLSESDVTVSQIPRFMLSAMTIVDSAVREAVSQKVIKEYRIYTEDNGRSYGYTILFDFDGRDLEAWFGVYLDAWRLNGKSPIWLQFYDEAADRVKSPLNAFGGLNPEDEKEWLGPLCPKVGVQEHEAVESLVRGLAQVKTALSSPGIL